MGSHAPIGRIVKCVTERSSVCTDIAVDDAKKVGTKTVENDASSVFQKL
jgi:hypothetical protein